MTERTDAADKIGWRWVLVLARVAAALLTLVLILVPHFAFRIFGSRDVVPPLFLSIVARIVGVRIRVVGKPQKHALLLGNHVSWLDIVVMGGTSRSAFVAHSGLSEHPFLAWLCLQNETLFITRDQRGTVGEQVDQVAEALGHRRLTIFPEATTGDGKSLLPFRSSLLSAIERLPRDLPVQPFALDFEEVEEIAWTGVEPGLANFRKILARTKPVYLTIRFLDPLEGEELTNRKTMAAAAQQRIAAALHM